MSGSKDGNQQPSQTPPGGSGGGSSPQPEIDPKAKLWVEGFIGSAVDSDKAVEVQQKRNRIIGVATLEIDLSPEALGGMKFDMLIKKDKDFRAKALALFGKQETMTTLTGTGDAMNEFDTHHDLGSVEPVAPETLNKAQKSLEKVAKASQQMTAEMMTLYAEEFGVDPADFDRLADELETLKKKRADEKRRKIPGSEGPSKTSQEKTPGKTPGQTGSGDEGDGKDWEKLAEKFEALRAKVDKEVRSEVWGPLVRQGLIPENFVPDRHSEVALTFDSASKLYQERLQAFTELQEDNAGALAKLGFGKDVTDKVMNFSQALIKAVPGSELYKDQIDTAFTCIEVINNTGFDVAGAILRKDEALGIAGIVSTGISNILGGIDGVPKDIAGYVTDGMQLALSGGKVVQAIMDGKPDAIWTAVGNAINQSLAVATTATGNDVVAAVGKDVASLIKASNNVPAVIKAMQAQPLDETAIQKALLGVMQDCIEQIGEKIGEVVQAETVSGNVSEQDGKLAQDVITDGTSMINALITVAISEDKAQAIVDGVGSLANRCFTNYMGGDYGATIGTAIENGLGSGSAFIKAVVAKKPTEALTALGDMLTAGLTGAAKAKGVPSEVATILSTTSDSITEAMAGMKGAADLKKAIETGNEQDMQTALQTLMKSVVTPVVQQITGDDSTDDSGDDSTDDSSEDGATEDQALTKAALKQKEAAEQKLRTIIENARKVIEDNKAPAEKVEKAKKDRDQAVKTLLEQKAAEEEVLADSEAFSKLLNPDDTEANEDDAEDTRSIEAMIATIQKDRMILKMVDTLSGMAIEVAAKFFPPASAAMDFKTFSIEAAKTVAHLRQLAVWMRNAQEARNAVTVQVHTMLNRVGLESDQACEHAARATVALVSAIGNVLTTVGAHAAPIGAAMVATAKIAGSALEIALTIKSEDEMRQAWAMYQKAMRNPKDRKNVRMALQKNATLAKYGLVWGALKDGNPIAKKALKRCGLTDAIIAKETANENKVVEFLEVLFDEDPVVLKCVPDMDGWDFKPPKPTLHMRTWIAFLQLAQSKGKLAANSGGAVTAAFAPLEQCRDHYATARQEIDTLKQEIADLNSNTVQVQDSVVLDKAAKKNVARANKVLKDKQAALEKALQGIIDACKAYRPLTTENAPHEKVTIYTEAMGALAIVELRELKGATVAIELDKAA